MRLLAESRTSMVISRNDYALNKLYSTAVFFSLRIPLEAGRIFIHLMALGERNFLIEHALRTKINTYYNMTYISYGQNIAIRCLSLIPCIVTFITPCRAYISAVAFCRNFEV